MVYTRMVEIGRIVLITNGKYEGKLAAITDVIDSNRILVDGPSSGVLRCVINLKDIRLTKFRLKIRPGMRTRNVRKFYDEANINEEWEKSSWGMRIARKCARAKLNDFDRFKLMRAKQLRNRLVRIEIAKLRKKSIKKVDGK